MKKTIKRPAKKVSRGNLGRGSHGIHGGIRRHDGSGRGVGNYGTSRQPSRKK